MKKIIFLVFVLALLIVVLKTNIIRIDCMPTFISVILDKIPNKIN